MLWQLYRTGSVPPVAGGGGVRSMLAPWMGGAAAVPGGTEPPIEPTPEVGGGAGYFSRRRWRKLRDLIEAEEAAERRAEELKRSAAKRELVAAAEVAEEVAEAIHASDAAPDIAPLTAALEAAASAKRLADVLASAKRAHRIALSILREIEEEEEAVMHLLLLS